MKTGSIMAFLGGMVVGGAIALLMAPDSGEKTREKIKGFVDKEYDELMEMAERMKNKAEREKRDVLAAVGEVEDGVRRGIEQLKEK